MSPQVANRLPARLARRPLLTLFILAAALAPAPRAKAQDVTRDTRDLGNKDPRVRMHAAEHLGNNGCAGVHEEEALPALVNALKDTDPSVRELAAFALGCIPSDGQTTVPALAKALRDGESSVRKRAAGALGSIHREPGSAVPALVGVLKDDEDEDVQKAALSALIKFGADAKPAVPILIELLKGNVGFLRWLAAQELGAIGPAAHDAAPYLAAALKDPDEDIRLEAAGSLAKIGQDQAEALPIPVRLLNHEDWHVRARAAGVLGEFGSSAKTAVPALTNLLKDEDEDVRRVASNALERIASALQKSSAADAADSLRVAETAMEQSQDRTVKSHSLGVADAVTALETSRRRSVKERVLGPVRAYPLAACVIGGYVAIASIWFSLYWLSPISLLRIDEAFRPLPKVRLPGWLGGVEISIPYLILLGLFRYRQRVLDAWAARNVSQARADFELIETVSKCHAQPEPPVLLDGESLPALGAGDLRPVFARTKACVLIWGEDESVKTRFACQIARWGMSPDPAQRVGKNLMLPILLEENFIYNGDRDADAFTKTVRDKLQFEGRPPSLELVVRLLESQRILVLIHGLSDLSPETQSILRPDRADFPAHALVVTSRVNEGWGGMRKTTIKPAC